MDFCLVPFHVGSPANETVDDAAHSLLHLSFSLTVIFTILQKLSMKDSNQNEKLKQANEDILNLFLECGLLLIVNHAERK